MDLLGKVVLSVQTETLLLLELLESIGSLTGCQCGTVLGKNERTYSRMVDLCDSSLHYKTCNYVLKCKYKN